eukprot:GFKZ01014111.1.p1 GENE.GFKZ01014111.1~~GFKZ01014111.1.p1  ORF type:complete len:130 (+),score=4.46 GFKZ01014111.1:95-484(+)
MTLCSANSNVLVVDNMQRHDDKLIFCGKSPPLNGAANNRGPRSGPSGVSKPGSYRSEGDNGTGCYRSDIGAVLYCPITSFVREDGVPRESKASISGTNFHPSLGFQSLMDQIVPCSTVLHPPRQQKRVG